MKPPEEGEIWEWRAFGRLSDSLAASVRSHQVRTGVSDLSGTDVYFIAPESNHNIKLRKWGEGWLLKLKLLISGARADSIELYCETSEMVFGFPVPASALQTVARLLGVRPARATGSADSYDKDQFVSALAASSPAVDVVKVEKVRSQFEFDGGWVELAEVRFPARSTQSISLHSAEIESVRRLIEILKPGPELEALNYVQACRKWR